MPLIAQTNVSSAPVNDLDVTVTIERLVGFSNGRVAPEGVGYRAVVTGNDVPPAVDYGDGGVYAPVYHELEYEWDFGDSGGTSFFNVVNIRSDKNDPNTARGPNVQHTFRDPGTYTVTCTVRDPKTGRTAQATNEVTVAAASSRFANADIFFIDPDNNSPDVPAGATVFTDPSAALLASFGRSNPTRLMFAWGSEVTIPVPAANAMDGTGHYLVSPPDTGSGADPIVNVTGSGALFRIDGMGNSFQMNGMDLRGPYDVLSETGTVDCNAVVISTSIRLVHIYNNKFQGFQDPVIGTGFTHNNDQRQFINNNYFRDWRNFAYSDFSDPGTFDVFKAAVGNRFLQDPNARVGTGDKDNKNTHGPIRIGRSDWLCILQNDMFSCTGWSTLGGGFQAIQPCIRINSEPRIGQFGVSNIWGNTFEGGNIIAEMGPSTEGRTTYPTNFVMHENLFIADHQTNRFISFSAGGASVKNNLFIRGTNPTLAGTGGGDPVSFFDWYKTTGATAEAEASPIFVANNTFMNNLDDADTSTGDADRARYDGTFNGGSPGVLNFIVGNNSFSQPNVATPVNTDVPYVLTPIKGADGVTDIVPVQRGYTPSGTGVTDTSLAAPADTVRLPSLGVGNPAIDSATSQVIVPGRDFTGTLRTGTLDRGAVAA